jgi:hypothetical protein
LSLCSISSFLIFVVFFSLFFLFLFSIQFFLLLLLYLLFSLPITQCFIFFFHLLLVLFLCILYNIHIILICSSFSVLAIPGLWLHANNCSAIPLVVISVSHLTEFFIPVLSCCCSLLSLYTFISTCMCQLTCSSCILLCNLTPFLSYIRLTCQSWAFFHWAFLPFFRFGFVICVLFWSTTSLSCHIIL